MELGETEILFRHPLHPYTKALLSAVPMPSPDRRTEGPPLIYDESVHDYATDKPFWAEIEPGHFVRANQKEWETYQEEIKKDA